MNLEHNGKKLQSLWVSVLINILDLDARKDNKTDFDILLIY